MTGRAHWCAAVAGLIVVAACGAESYIELQIADPDLPFLQPEVDFDGLVVEARALECAASETRYPAAPLPASLTLLPGACYKDRLRLRTWAMLGERRVAASTWVETAFPDSGPLVVTATLADLPGRRTLFATGFEPGDPFGDLPGGLPVVVSEGVDALEGRVSREQALTGTASAYLAGVATSSVARVYVRVAALNVVLARGDELVFTLEVDEESTLTTLGIDLELSTGATAEILELVDRRGRPIHPASNAGRDPGVRQQWAVDLTAAAGARIVGVLLAMDARGAGKGVFGVRVDDLAIVRP